MPVFNNRKNKNPQSPRPSQKMTDEQIIRKLEKNGRKSMGKKK